jgi:hypothetical protein
MRLMIKIQYIDYEHANKGKKKIQLKSSIKK